MNVEWKYFLKRNNILRSWWTLSRSSVLPGIIIIILPFILYNGVKLDITSTKCSILLTELETVKLAEWTGNFLLSKFSENARFSFTILDLDRSDLLSRIVFKEPSLWLLVGSWYVLNWWHSWVIELKEDKTKYQWSSKL